MSRKSENPSRAEKKVFFWVLITFWASKHCINFQSWFIRLFSRKLEKSIFNFRQRMSEKQVQISFSCLRKSFWLFIKVDLDEIDTARFPSNLACKVRKYTTHEIFPFFHYIVEITHESGDLLIPPSHHRFMHINYKFPLLTASYILFTK